MNCFDETENDLRKRRYVIRSKFQIINEDNELEAMPSAFRKINVSSRHNVNQFVNDGTVEVFIVGSLLEFLRGQPCYKAGVANAGQRSPKYTK